MPSDFELYKRRVTRRKRKDSIVLVLLPLDSTSTTTTTSSTTKTTMEEDSELLDWGNEDDESQAQASYPSHYSQRNSVPHDAEDAVSLGGDDDDLHEFSAYQSRPVHDAEQFSHSRSSRPPSTPQRQQTPPPKHRERSGSPHKSSRRNDSPSLIRSQPLSMAKLTHALPPKPVLATASIARSPPLASTLASSMIQRERRLNGQSRGKSVSVEASDGLPPDWEIRYPRNGGREAYYYNVRTHESTWTRPQDVVHVASPAKDSRDSRARSLSRSVDDGAHSQGLPRTALHKDSKRRTSPAPVVTTELTYEDRHYRPGDSTVNAQTDRVPRAQARPLSPARSVTPPPRREALARRDLSRSLSPVNDSWRPNARDEDRSWGRHRNEDTRSLSPETRPRGRRQRADIEMPPLEDESIRRDHSREWPAHSTLSASYPPSPSPSGTRRLCSSRGGGSFCKSLKKPRGLSYAKMPLRFPTTTLRNRLEDARHHGSLFVFSFIMSLLQASLPFLTSSLFLCFSQDIGRHFVKHRRLFLTHVVEWTHGNRLPRLYHQHRSASTRLIEYSVLIPS